MKMSFSHKPEAWMPARRMSAYLALMAGAMLAPSAALAGAVEGQAKFAGDPPARGEIRMLEVSLAGARNSECVKLHKDGPLLSDEVIVGDGGGLANVVVYVDSKVEGDFEVSAEPAILDQVGCTYTPHILTMQAGQTLEVKNSDPLVHNVRSFAEKNRPFNMGQTEGNVREKVLRKKELEIKVKCDIHRWMTAYIFVFGHPFYAVTDETGNFSIEGLPAGEHTLVAWHEVYGRQEAKVTVGEDGAATASFTFAAPAESE
jgi:plastocyanin